jgi:hypothetical protein
VIRISSRVRIDSYHKRAFVRENNRPIPCRPDVVQASQEVPCQVEAWRKLPGKHTYTMPGVKITIEKNLVLMTTTDCALTLESQRCDATSPYPMGPRLLDLLRTDRQRA